MRRSLIVANKMDLPGFRQNLVKFASLFPRLTYQIFPVCAQRRVNVGAVAQHMRELIDQQKLEEEWEAKNTGHAIVPSV